MEILLDSHTLLWFYKGDDQLSIKVKNLILDVSNTCNISIVILW